MVEYVLFLEALGMPRRGLRRSGELFLDFLVGVLEFGVVKAPMSSKSRRGGEGGWCGVEWWGPRGLRVGVTWECSSHALTTWKQAAL